MSHIWRVLVLATIPGPFLRLVRRQPQEPVDDNPNTQPPFLTRDHRKARPSRFDEPDYLVAYVGLIRGRSSHGVSAL